MDSPTPEWIRTTSNIEFVEYGYGVPDSGPDRMDTLIIEALPEFQAYTGIDIAMVDDDPVTGDKRVPLMLKAIRMLVEFNSGASQPEILATAVDYDMISAFGAGPYNETRRSIAAERNILHPWPALNKLLRGIVFFDSAGMPIDGPAIKTAGRWPKAGQDVMPPRCYPWQGPYSVPMYPGITRETW